jgi:hypothetical protein
MLLGWVASVEGSQYPTHEQDQQFATDLQPNLEIGVVCFHMQQVAQIKQLLSDKHGDLETWPRVFQQ